MVAWKTEKGKVAVIGGARTPFVKAGGTLRHVPMTELARRVFEETLYRCAWPADRIDEVVLGNVVMPADAANPSRVAAVQAGIAREVPAMTIQRNCASGLEAVAEAAAHVRNETAQVVLTGGAESMSNVPLLLPMETLEPMERIMRARTAGKRLAALSKLRPRHFKPVPALLQGLTDPLCGLIMGKTAEVLAQEFAISRQEQDDWALLSHQRAVAAEEDGRFNDQRVTVFAGPRFKPVPADIGPRTEQSIEALGRLQPIFDRRDGTVTVGNACQVTDGAAAMLLANGDLARAQGLEVLGHVKAYAVAALDPAHMGLGPVHAIDQVLRMTGMGLRDIDLFEINEAFAAQVLACLQAAASDLYCREHLGRDEALGEIPTDTLNVNGGAIALGHPVGATGARMVLAMLHEMRRCDVQYGLVALCVAGGQGVAMLLERSE